MRLPTDPAQWGVVVIQSLVQKIPSLEPYIQLAHLVDTPTPEGDGFGVVPLLNGTGFIPFTVRRYELSPLDLLITVEAGQDKFTNLSEGAAVMACGGLPMGEPTAKLPPGVEEDMEMDFMPPYETQFGQDRNVVPGRYTSTKSVKLSHSSPEAIEELLKSASERSPDLARFMGKFYLDELRGLATQKQASEATDAIFTLEPTSQGILFMRDGDVKAASLLSLPQAGQVLRELGEGDKAAHLFAGDLVAVDRRPVEKRAGVWNHEEIREHHEYGQQVKVPGWYKVEGLRMRVFQASYLDGKPTTFWLAVHPTGYIFRQHMWGTPCDPPTNQDMRGYYHAAHLVPGESAFLVEETSMAASVPFVVIGGGKVRDDVEVVVTPMLGEANEVRLSFGPNQNRYSMGIKRHEGHVTESIAMPRKGFTAFHLGKDLAGDETLGFGRMRNLPMSQGAEPVTVRLYRGGGVFSVKEGLRALLHGLNRGQLAALLIRRYGMTPEQALTQVRHACDHTDTSFKARPKEETRRHAAVVRKTFMKVALDLWDFTRKVAAESEKAKQKVKPDPKKDEAPGGSGPGPAGSPGQAGDAQKNGPKAEGAAGPQQPQQGAPGPGQAPGGAQAGPPGADGPPGAPGGMPGAGGAMQAEQLPTLANTGAAMMPDIPNLQQISDMLTSYATGSFAPDELSDIYNQLADRLEDVCDLVGRVLLLARLGKVDFITEAEAKRLLEESDKLRAALLNADMLLKGLTVAA